MINCIITPTNHFHDSFSRTIKSVMIQTINDWEWIVVNDSGLPLDKSNDIVKLILSDRRIKIIDNYRNSGAGCARNCGLDYVKKKYKTCNLFFIDAGDEWFDQFIEKSLLYFQLYGNNIISTSYLMRWPESKTKEIIISGSRTYKNMLEDYSTGCISTALKLDDTSILSEIRFGETIRVNDQPFFLSAVKHYGSVMHVKDIMAIYYVGDPSSLSGKKIYTAIGKWKVLKNQNINFLYRYYCFILYFLSGIKRYYM